MGDATLTGLDGKVAVVTGAGRMRSIGRPIAVDLAAAGCKIVLTGTGRDPSRYPDDEKEAGWRDIASVSEEVTAAGSEALAVVSDVRDPVAIEALADETLERFGRVDFVINNAGAARGADRKPVTEVDVDVWRNVLETNLIGTFLMSRTFGQRLIAQGEGGCIINISSIAGKMLPPNASAYASSKAGIQALTACMAQEVGKQGIRVNAICPGIIDTYRMDDIGRGEAWDKMVKTRIPLQRPGKGTDISAMAVFLCSEQGAWTTGQSINVDGGAAFVRGVRYPASVIRRQLFDASYSTVALKLARCSSTWPMRMAWTTCSVDMVLPKSTADFASCSSLSWRRALSAASEFCFSIETTACFSAAACSWALATLADSSISGVRGGSSAPAAMPWTRPLIGSSPEAK